MDNSTTSPLVQFLPLIVLVTVIILVSKLSKKSAVVKGGKIKETKATCKACDNVFFYGKKDEVDNCGNSFTNCGADLDTAGKNMLCCSGCLPAAFMPEASRRQTVDLNKCPKCGSRAITKETVVHEI